MKLPVIKPQQLIKVLEKKECVFKRQTGSHRIFYCPYNQKIITISIHNRDIKKDYAFYYKRIKFISRRIY
jgi:predicted RNA binding protein YcfA (HicA-like mRNA interferase family)